MADHELETCLNKLRLSQADAAQLLGVAPRTVRRWLEGEEVPGPAAAALRAWQKLAARGLPWRPDSVSIVEDDQDQIARHRAHAINLNALLERVEARGGARLPWVVSRKDCVATLGSLEVSYHKLLNGGFSLTTYTRKDGEPDVERDQELIEDAAFCIARELRKAPEFGPVTLIYHDRPWRKGAIAQTVEELASNEAAIQRVCALMESRDFHDPFIVVGSEILWDKQALRDEYRRRKTGPSALRAVAEYIRHNSSSFARGPRPLTRSESEQRRRHIEALAAEIDALAATAEREPSETNYQDFEPILRELHKVGFFPEPSLVSAIADALVRA